MDIPQSLTHGQCNVRAVVTFLAAEHCPWLVLLSRPAEDRKLCWPEWLITYQDRCSHPTQY